MTGLTKDFIAIDVNIFEQLLNRNSPHNHHITVIIRYLIEKRIRLLVDSSKKINSEYYKRLGRFIQKNSERRKDRILLIRILHPKNLEQVDVNIRGKLMVKITKLIPVTKKADRFYVYVAFKRGRVLVTNDEKDIGNKRQKLLRETKKCRAQEDEDILNSQEAYDKLEAI